jgi:CPA2 family monovalent cation:H+ antiporter-2
MRTNFLSILANVEIPMLADIVWIFGLATVVILLFVRFNIPTIIGFLLTGALAGPFGFSLVNASQTVEVFSEIGVILLLFVIGLEFSLKSLLSIKKAVFVGGALQVVLTVLATYLASTLLGFDWNVAVFIGFLFSLSSTAIVLKLLQEEGKVGSISGRTTLAILIFQDIAIVPLMLLTPMLAGANDNVGWSLFWLGLKGIGVVILTLIGAKYLVPKLLYRIAASKSEELFLLSIIDLLCGGLFDVFTGTFTWFGRIFGWFDHQRIRLQPPCDGKDPSIQGGVPELLFCVHRNAI